MRVNARKMQTGKDIDVVAGHTRTRNANNVNLSLIRINPFFYIICIFTMYAMLIGA